MNLILFALSFSFVSFSIHCEKFILLKLVVLIYFSYNKRISEKKYLAEKEMSESSVYFDSDDDSKKEDCALVDAVSELNFENGSLIEVGQSNNDLASAQLTSSEDPESSNTSLNNYVEDEYDYMHDSEWINQRCQVFILSTAGKPIYSLHGSEEKLSTLFGLLQALVSVVSASNDAIR